MSTVRESVVSVMHWSNNWDGFRNTILSEPKEKDVGQRG